jgi:organic radical activating enzyme
MAKSGYLQELFASFQGEGIHLGRRHVFVRTAGCSLRCRYCDTPKALVRTPSVEVQQPDGERLEYANPVSVSQVVGWVERLDPGRDSWVAFTGGEPLEQAEFLSDLADALHQQGRPIYLETAGVHATGMEALRDRVDCVAFDLKLDSVAGEGDRRAEHRAFLRASDGLERMAKVIFHDAVDLGELDDLLELVAGEDPSVPLILQPETPRQGPAPVAADLLEKVHSVARRRLADVRVIPQVHRYLQVP